MGEMMFERGELGREMEFIKATSAKAKPVGSQPGQHSIHCLPTKLCSQDAH